MSTRTEPLRPVARPNRLKTWTIIIATNVLALVCMAWVLNGAGLHQIWSEVQHMSWNWVSLAVVCDVCVYLLHGLRWRLMLLPVARIPYLQTIEAIYVGLFANEVFPFRAGELIRCFLLSKSSKLPLSVSFASALIERIFDGVWLMVCFFISLHMSVARMPPILLKFGYILGAMIVVLAIILGIAMYAKKQSLGSFFGLSWPRWFDILIEDLHLIGHSRYLYFSFLISGVYLLAQIVPIYALVRANHLDVPWTASFTMMVLLRLTSVIPQAPGNLGSFQWVAARTLIMFSVASGPAKRFSLILWAIMTIPLILIGFLAVALEGINMTHLRREAASAASERKSPAE